MAEGTSAKGFLQTSLIYCFPFLFIVFTLLLLFRPFISLPFIFLLSSPPSFFSSHHSFFSSFPPFSLPFSPFSSFSPLNSFPGLKSVTKLPLIRGGGGRGWDYRKICTSGLNLILYIEDNWTGFEVNIHKGAAIYLF